MAQRFLLIEDGRVSELTDVSRWHEAFEHSTAATPATADDAADVPTATTDADSQDDLLARIVELEEKLDADRARRPKFQKPDRQAAWAEEIAALYARL